MAAKRRRNPLRFLAAGGRGGNGHGYLTQPGRRITKTADPDDVIELVASRTALVDEPECVGPAILDAYGEDARHYQSLRRLAEIQVAREARTQLPVEARLADARRRAKAQHIDVSGKLRVIDGLLKRAAAGGRREPPAELRMLAEVEAQLDGVTELLAS
jgi:hypothetical protein